MTRSLEKKNKSIPGGEISTRSGWDLIRFCEISPNPVYILLDLKYFNQKLVGKGLNGSILVSFMVGSIEEGFRGENPSTDPLESVFGSVTYCQHSELLDWSLVGRFRSSLVGWVRSRFGWTPLIGHIRFSIENVCKLRASYKGQKSSGSWNQTK